MDKNKQLLQEFKEINDVAQREILEKVGNILDLQSEVLQLKEEMKVLQEKLSDTISNSIFSLDESVEYKKQCQIEARKELEESTHKSQEKSK